MRHLENKPHLPSFVTISVLWSNRGNNFQIHLVLINNKNKLSKTKTNKKKPNPASSALLYELLQQAGKNKAAELGGQTCGLRQSPNKRVFDASCCSRAAVKRTVINFLSGKHFRSTLLLWHSFTEEKKGILAGFSFSTCMIRTQEWIPKKRGSWVRLSLFS